MYMQLQVLANQLFFMNGSVNRVQNALQSPKFSKLSEINIFFIQITQTSVESAANFHIFHIFFQAKKKIDLLTLNQLQGMHELKHRHISCRYFHSRRRHHKKLKRYNRTCTTCKIFFNISQQSCLSYSKISFISLCKDHSVHQASAILNCSRQALTE